MGVYQIVDDFQVQGSFIRIIVLDRSVETLDTLKVLTIDGQVYEPVYNSISCWVQIINTNCFKDKTVVFRKRTDEDMPPISYNEWLELKALGKSCRG